MSYHQDLPYIELESKSDLQFRMQSKNIFCLIDGTWLRCWWLDIFQISGSYLNSMRTTHAPKNWVEGKGHTVAEKVKIKPESLQVHHFEDESYIYVTTWAGLLYSCEFDMENHKYESNKVKAAIEAIGYIELPGDWEAVK